MLFHKCQNYTHVSIRPLNHDLTTSLLLSVALSLEWKRVRGRDIEHEKEKGGVEIEGYKPSQNTNYFFCMLSLELWNYGSHGTMN